MRPLMRHIDKFCLTHRRFGVPRLMLYVIIGYAAAFLIAAVDMTGTVASLLAFRPDLILKGQVWRLISWVVYPSGGAFLSPSSLLFTGLMLYFYYFIGMTLEREWGTPKFNVYYLVGILIHVVFGFAVWLVSGSVVYFDSSFLNLSMFFAFATLYPEQQVLLLFIFPVKIKWLALVDAGYFVLSSGLYLARGEIAAALLPLVAASNFLLFCWDDLRQLVMQHVPARRAMSFRRAARQKLREESSRPYRHKCAVCGKTDIDYPDLEFRYCSRCNGYHCFCIDHINSHIHFR